LNPTDLNTDAFRLTRYFSKYYHDWNVKNTAYGEKPACGVYLRRAAGLAA
jgi:hypothetical protein